MRYVVEVEIPAVITLRGRIEADSNVTPGLGQAAGSPQICVGMGGGGCGGDLNDDGPGSECPIVLNPGGGPWRLTGADDPVNFDLDGDGVKRRIGWTERGASLAFLAKDLNGNGEIDDGSELFGVGTQLPTGERANDGFEALRQYDANGDRLITASDPVWTSLLLWTDRNHDGASQPSELRPISTSEFTALSLEYYVTRRRDAHGNSLRYRSRSRAGGVWIPFYDIFFARVP